jgi:hypothetical protein
METLEINSCRPELRRRTASIPTWMLLDGTQWTKQLRNSSIRALNECKPWLKAPFVFWYSSTLSIVLYSGVVAGVSFYDLFLTVKYSESLEHMEMNPLGRWLMGLDYLRFGEQPDITLFLAMKTLGTLFVLFVMVALFKRATRIGHPVALGVASFQLLLAFYLTCWLPEQ